MKCRRKISSHVKTLEYLGVLPQNYRRQLNPAQLYRYRQRPPENYYGYELTALVDKEIEFIRTMNEFTLAKKLCNGIIKLFILYRTTVARIKGFKTALRKEKLLFARLAQRFNGFIPIRSFSKLIGTDESTLRNWIRQERNLCQDSIINRCHRAHPNQLLPSEINKMEKLLADEEFRFWPLSSLFYHGLKNKIISIGKSTWYKYAAILNVKRLKPKSAKVKTTGIRASKPNELWHADVTYFYTPERMKLYVYTVVDNFSRFPLCVKVSEKLSGAFRAETFREALRKAVEINPGIENLKLMTDGGAENFNGSVENFLNAIETIDIKHIKALSDGWPSNSMAEAFHYTLKIFYLNQMDIRTLSALNKALGFAVDDYSRKRPHAALKGLTPYQVYTGEKPEDISFKKQMKEVRIIRIIMNQNHKCSGKCNF
jgi:transposase InsO family protein